MIKNLIIFTMIFVLTSCEKRTPSSSPQWTYKVISSLEVMSKWLPEELLNGSAKDSEKIAKLIEDKLNEYGKQGWEVVSFNGRVILKKEKP